MGLFYNSDLYKPEKAVHDMTVDEFIASLGDSKLRSRPPTTHGVPCFSSPTWWPTKRAVLRF